MTRSYQPQSPTEQAPWLCEAERLAANGLLIPDIAAALSQLGYPDLVVTLAVAAVRSDVARATRDAPKPAFPFLAPPL